MNLADIRTQVFQRLDEDPANPLYFTNQMAVDAINEGLNIFSSLTWCVEKTASLTITDTYTDLLGAAIPRVIAPLKLYRGTTRMHPARPQEFAAEDTYWRIKTGTAKRYGMMGATLLVLDLKPTSGTVFTLTYAATAADLAADSDVPEIPLEDHPAIVDYAEWRMLATSGGAEFVAAKDPLGRFLAVAAKRAAAIRERFSVLGYDRKPKELKQPEESE